MSSDRWNNLQRLQAAHHGLWCHIREDHGIEVNGSTNLIEAAHPRSPPRRHPLA